MIMQITHYLCFEVSASDCVTFYFCYNDVKVGIKIKILKAALRKAELSCFASESIITKFVDTDKTES